MSLFVRKDIGSLLAEAGSGTLRRELGPLALVTLGIGAVIGAGIFVMSGTVASQNAGPALTLSMVFAGIACVFAGLCYAELASMIPVAGSAYTYAYATMGELVAWIIGWDLVLEYSLSSSTVAVGWSAYAVTLLGEMGITIPPRLTGAPGVHICLPDGTHVIGVFNLPAMVICLALTGLLVIGIRESARVNTTIVIIKVAVLAIFVAFGAHYVNTANLHPFIPPNTGQFGSFGWSGILRGAGIIFFAYIGFDAVSTASQEAKNPGRDIPIGILVSLAICTVIYISVGLVMTGLVPYTSLNVASPIAVAVQATGLKWLAPIINIGAICGLSSVILVNMLAQSRIFYSMSRDGLLPPLFARLHPPVSHSARDDRDHRTRRRNRFRPVSNRGAGPAREHGNSARVRDRVHGSPDPAQNRTRHAPTVQDTGHAVGAHRGNSHLSLPDVRSPAPDVDQVVRVAGRRTDDLLHVRKISRCRGTRSADRQRRLMLQSSREDRVPRSERWLGLEVRIHQPQRREQRQDRGNRLREGSKIEIGEGQLEDTYSIRLVEEL